MPPLRGMLLIGLLWLGSPISAETPLDEPDPQAYLRQVMQNPNLTRSGSGELFCWHAASAANDFLDAYEAYGNRAWLRMAERYYAFYLEKLQKDPDGLEGWIGDPIQQQGTSLSTDALVGDAILCEPLVRFAWIVLVREPDLRDEFGKTAERYVELATRIIWTKWNQRGCYKEDANGWGSYRIYWRLIDRKNNKWVSTPSRAISDNLNKHYSAGLVLLRLWQITGRDEYKHRVKAIFGRAKSMWRHDPETDRVMWNFWMPHGPYDLRGRAPLSWVGVHPQRAGYQAGEVADWVAVYHAGLVFDEQDIRRIIRTNHWMMPNADRDHWLSADGSSRAGTLWTALAEFDETIRNRYEAQLKRRDTPHNRIKLAYLENVTKKHLGYDRRWTRGEPELIDVPLQPGTGIAMSLVIPTQVDLANERRVQLACQTRAEGTLKIELLDASSREVLGTIYEAKTSADSEYHAPFFDGTHPGTGEKKPGQYLIRWSLAGEARTQPVHIIADEPGIKGLRPPSLAPGQRISEDFEKPLHPRWQLDRAKVSSDQARTGKHSLMVTGQAELTFGRQDDLPVKITLWVWDNDAKHGKKSVNGPAWGLTTALGDRFVLRQVWRTYLNGDREYAWLNSGENQWFTPHPSGVLRKAGWNQWNFDFSDPTNPKISGNDTSVRRLVPRFTPNGAVGLFILNGSGGPIYIDDLTIEYPAKP